MHISLQVLEDGIAEVVGPATPVGDKAFSPSSSVESTGPERKVTGDSTLGDPVLTLGISVGEEQERTLFYYAGQVEITEHLVMSLEA